MSSLALMEVQRALYTKLTSDGVLMGMVVDVADAVPQKTALPYVVIGDGQYETLATDAMNLSQLQMVIDIWSDVAGRKTILAIMNRIYALLHLGTLTISGFSQVLLRCEQADTALSEDATRMHGTMRVHITVVE